MLCKGLAICLALLVALSWARVPGRQSVRCGLGLLWKAVPSRPQQRLMTGQHFIPLGLPAHKGVEAKVILRIALCLL